MIIRPHTGDRRALMALFQLADDSAIAIASYIDAGEILVAVVSDDPAGNPVGHPVGHVQIVPTDKADACEIKSLAVVEDRQGQGIGRALVAAAIDHARKAGARRLIVATATADIDNLRFYQKAGFRMVAIERDAFTPAAGYPDGLMADGIPVRDRAWFELAL